MSLLCIRWTTLLVSCHRVCPSLLIRTCLMFQRLGINFALFTTSSPTKLPADRSFYLRGHLPTKLCFESETNWTLLSFAVVTFRIIKSVSSLRLRSFVNRQFSIRYQIWILGQSNLLSQSDLITARGYNVTLNVTLLAVPPAPRQMSPKGVFPANREVVLFWTQSGFTVESE